ncbi:hypothetical protein CP880_04350 [Cutibacterium namnetense]|uniref:Uncharacterized protein n=1 Tax=Cutibacterium namnetense TaxID=1574624 RepID=A0ABX9ICE1_9ACTN|nr:hypothetical protein CP880_04350 [Cutibacterium namnetense]TKW72347.1 MAG: hypothetical protein DI580_04415 [Cutibacterium acnes]
MEGVRDRDHADLADSGFSPMMPRQGCSPTLRCRSSLMSGIPCSPRRWHLPGALRDTQRGPAIVTGPHSGLDQSITGSSFW